MLLRIWVIGLMVCCPVVGILYGMYGAMRYMHPEPDDLPRWRWMLGLALGAALTVLAWPILVPRSAYRIYKAFREDFKEEDYYE